jgi:hypothetical protein
VTPAETRQPAKISTDFDARRFTLAGALAMWGNHGGTGPQPPDARRAASYAIGLIDAMTAELSEIREQLLTEISASDAAAAGAT